MYLHVGKYFLSLAYGLWTLTALSFIAHHIYSNFATSTSTEQLRNGTTSIIDRNCSSHAWDHCNNRLGVLSTIVLYSHTCFLRRSSCIHILPGTNDSTWKGVLLLGMWRESKFLCLRMEEDFPFKSRTTAWALPPRRKQWRSGAVRNPSKGRDSGRSNVNLSINPKYEPVNKLEPRGQLSLESPWS